MYGDSPVPSHSPAPQLLLSPSRRTIWITSLMRCARPRVPRNSTLQAPPVNVRRRPQGPEFAKYDQRRALFARLLARIPPLQLPLCELSPLAAEASVREIYGLQEPRTEICCCGLVRDRGLHTVLRSRICTLAILSHACRRRFRRVGQHVRSVGQAQRPARAVVGVATRETRVWRRSEGAILSRKSPAHCLAPRSLVLQSSQVQTAARAIVRSVQVHVISPSSHWRSPLAAGARIPES
ncbi:hypothetical protein DENSPDRAFT_84273 [Dentipellis sp. KUC8613]|nr:hypothetical protein DENSPDRAFT_84273 [Dentipellis sp. KUC8613]